MDLRRPKTIVKVVTQGRSDANQWVTKFYIKYSSDAFYWVPYKKFSRVKVRSCRMALFTTGRFLARLLTSFFSAVLNQRTDTQSFNSCSFEVIIAAWPWRDLMCQIFATEFSASVVSSHKREGIIIVHVWIKFAHFRFRSRPHPNYRAFIFIQQVASIFNVISFSVGGSLVSSIWSSCYGGRVVLELSGGEINSLSSFFC